MIICQTIRNTIFDTFKEDLINERVYSLIIDESTGISVNNYLCIWIRYFNKDKRKTITNFLGFTECVCATADILSECIKKFPQKLHLNIDNVIGLAPYGVNICGKNNSVYVIFNLS